MALVSALGGRSSAPQRRVLAVACGAHVVHDGFTDLLYVLLPVWQAEFGLGYAAVGLMRALYVGAMAGFQVPAGLLAERISPLLLLGIGTAVAGAGYVFAGISLGFAMLVGALVASGLGSGVQHPVGAHLVARAFSGGTSRIALARYNFSGDLGKVAFPAATAWLLTAMPWRTATVLIGVVGLVGAAAILSVRGHGAARQERAQHRQAAGEGWGNARGFWLLVAIAVIDSATRMGFLTFLPFLLKLKGAQLPMIGTALMLVFAGGAAGKLGCGWLGQRLGVVWATIVTEGLTAVGIALLLPLGLAAGLILLPLIGMMLNGTSSVLYGTVPELVAAHRQQRAFGIFYTAGVGAGALAPIVYGLVSDRLGVSPMMLLVAGVALATLPLALALGRHLTPGPR